MVLLAAGTVISIARWGWRRFRPAGAPYQRTYVELIPLLAGTRAFFDGALVLWEVPPSVLMVWRVVGLLPVLGMLILFVRMCIMLAERANRRFRPAAAARRQAVVWPTHAWPGTTIAGGSVAGQGGLTTTLPSHEPVTPAGIGHKAPDSS
ncbi:hypothetical protein PV350_10795 [Streptomyces sp. PA03-6a]|nr:hypothetical protein [Streptomyces sp. PA03-6a]